jgi:hypothetical protein
MKIMNVGAMLIAALFVQNAMADDSVECASSNYQPQTCFYNGGRDVDVSVALQESNPGPKGGSCIEGTDWTAFDGQITVLHGCRARFKISGRGHGGGGGWGRDDHGGGGRDDHGGGGWGRDDHGGGRGGGSVVVSCDSVNNSPNQCEMPRGRVRDVTVIEQRSRAKHGQGSCNQGGDWSYDDRFVYVRNGCRASFRVDLN